MAEAVTLTDASVKKLVPRKATKLIRDTTPGLALYVGKSALVWRYMYRSAAGQSEYVAIGRSPAMSLSDARLKAIHLDAERRKGNDPKADFVRPSEASTVGDVLDYHLRTLKETTAKSVRSTYKPLRAEWGARPAHSLTAEKLKAFLETPHYALRQGSAEHVVINLTRAYKLALSPLHARHFNMPKGLENPARGLRAELRWPEAKTEAEVAYAERERSHAKNWSDEEWEGFWRGLSAAYQDTSTNPLGLMVIELAALTGSRPGELKALRWDEVKKRDGVDVIDKGLRNKLGHKGHKRCIRLGDEAVAVLDRAKAYIAVMGWKPSDYVFPQSPITRLRKRNCETFKATVTHINNIDAYVKKIAKLGGITFKAYNLRSGYINAAVDALGMDELETVAANVGHTDVATTLKYYRRADDRRLAKGAKAADAVMAGIKRSAQPKPQLMKVVG